MALKALMAHILPGLMALRALMAQHFPAGSRAPRSFPPEVRLNRVSTCPRKVRRTADPSAALGMTKGTVVACLGSFGAGSFEGKKRGLWLA